MSGGYLDQEAELDMAQGEGNKNYFSRIKDTIMKLATYAALLWILYSYLNILGTEKSQEVKYIS
jgi:hypothetical protein